MKLGVITLIRNEIDIVGSFLRHIDALFDYALLLNHHSIDGTRSLLEQACARRPGWTVWQVEPVGYHQTAFSQFALRHLLLHTDADVVMFLDADEFIDVADRASLEAAFARLTDADRVGYLRWRNIIPARLDSRTIVPGEAVWRAPTRLQLGKVVVPRPFYARHCETVRLTAGNHAFYFEPEESVPIIDVGEILHLPIRSHEQIKGKVLAGVFSVMARAEREPLQCWHWYDILWRIGDGTLRDDDVIGMAVHYGVPGSQTTVPVAWDDLPARDFTPTHLGVAFGPPMSAVVDAPPSIETARLVATVLRGFQVEDVRGSTLALDGNRLRFVTDEGRA
ncbi:MAG: glycosyltransferase family 2 protein [Acetobacteraceae bacterium]